eukprot:16445389-Heterocapsa_arctica.AAC.1
MGTQRPSTSLSRAAFKPGSCRGSWRDLSAVRDYEERGYENGGTIQGGRTSLHTDGGRGARRRNEWDSSG